MKKTEIIKFFGSASQLARLLGVTRGAVNHWPSTVPYSVGLRCLAVAIGFRGPEMALKQFNWVVKAIQKRLP